MDIVAIWVMKKQILLPKEEPIYITLTFLKLPIPKVIRERTKQNIWTKWRDAHPSQFRGYGGKDSPGQLVNLTVVTSESHYV